MSTDLAESTGPLERIPPTDPMRLLQSALDKPGMDPEKLTRLVDLVEKWKAQRAVEDFSIAMNACQAEMPPIVQDAVNDHTHKRYASLEAVNRVCKPCYTRHGFSIQFSEGAATVEGDIRILADVMHAGGHERRYWIDLPRDGTGAKGGQSSMNPIQGKGSTFSYGCRYLVKMVFNLTITGEDDDAQGSAQDLTDAQTIELNELLEDLRGDTAEEVWETYIAGFWAWAFKEAKTTKNMNDLKASDFPRIKNELERLKKKKGGGK